VNTSGRSRKLWEHQILVNGAFWRETIDQCRGGVPVEGRRDYANPIVQILDRKYRTEKFQGGELSV